MSHVIDRLAALGIALPAPAAPVAAYVPTVEHGGLLHISGQLPFRPDGSWVTGRLGDDVDLAGGQEAARLCGIMLVAQIGAALGGDWSRVERIVKLGVFVNSSPDFTDQPQVANGASELMEAVFGDAGKHARSAVGVAVLPRAAAVEVDAIVAVRPA
jgi:enamine deaminase RidA (YjgF/YER057c/UK114 family)